ncbi:GntP family permease [Luteococcus sp. Sow4_B9]|uniref:GntP family permease n=1 Tax=Luteococcus sp. Sow4_B9 TaxID=3438792 RepID=UPI003F99B167
MTLGLLGIIVSLVVLIALAYRGVSVVIAAPICAFFAMAMSGAPLLAGYTEIFMPALGNFVKSYFPLFATGAIFGALMTAAGYAKAIAEMLARTFGARHALVATALTSGLLTYGGISTFVVVFVMFPLALELFRAADIPRRLMPAAIAVGSLTFTMTALPGSPQIQNIIPGNAFETTAFAAPGLGLIGAALMLGGSLAWLTFRRRQLANRGEHFAGMKTSDGDQRVDEHSEVSRESTEALLTPAHPALAFIPLAAMFLVNLACTLWILPARDWSFLENDPYKGATLGNRIAVWSALVAMLAAVLSVLLLNIKHLGLLWEIMGKSVSNAFIPILSTASEVGYGAVIASAAAFAIIRDGIINVSGHALIASAVSTSVVCGITGSASGGMTIALNAMGDELKRMALEQGVSLEAMHRITAMASGGLDSMPHNGAVITLLLVCGLTHRESYQDVFMVTLVIPVLTVITLIPIAITFGSF